VPSALSLSLIIGSTTTRSYAISYDKGQRHQPAHAQPLSPRWCAPMTSSDDTYARMPSVAGTARARASAISLSLSLTSFHTTSSYAISYDMGQRHQPARTPHESYYLQADVHPHPVCHQLSGTARARASVIILSLSLSLSTFQNTLSCTINHDT